MLYAHSLEGRPPEEWQLLDNHLEAVAKQAAEMASVFSASDFAFIIGWLHDLGKASAAGQARISGVGPKVDHSTAGARELIRQWETRYGANGKVMASCLSYCIVGHHAGLPDYGRHDCEKKTLRHRLNEEDYVIPNYRENSEKIDVPDFEWLRNPIPTNVGEREVKFFLSFFIRMLFSCLTDADWLDTERFCDVARSNQRRKDWPTVDVLTDRLLKNFSEKKWLVEDKGRVEAVFEEKNSSLSKAERISGARKAVLAWSLKAAQERPGVFSLTVPTGGGKTASSIAFSLAHARKHGLRRIILVVPYTSIIEQNARELREWLGEDAVIEHHSTYIHPSEREENSGENDDRPDAYQAQQIRLATENWDATVIVTTAVQFFESLFSNKPSRCRKLHNIAKSVVIFDEAQMIPIGLLKPSVLAMKQLANHYGSTLLFCTATQPALTKDVQFPGFDETEILEIVPKPQLLKLFTMFKRVKFSHLGKLDDATLVKRLNEENQVLCIVNTRKRAREIYDVAFDSSDGNEWIHLSARMTPAHRREVLENVIKKRLVNGEPCKVISTSLIECGVDISFPSVFREEGGLDSVAQAAGRCNRHGELVDGGFFYVFESASGLPKSAYDLQRRATLFNSVYQRNANDLFGPDAVRTYFSELRRYANTDESKILDYLSEMNSKTDVYRFDFDKAANAYRFIEEDMVSVIVENDVKGKNDSFELVRRVEEGEEDPNIFRRLQQHTVQIYSWEVEPLKANGALQLIQNRFYVLRNGIGYDENLGLVADDPSHMGAEAGIF